MPTTSLPQSASVSSPKPALSPEKLAYYLSQSNLGKDTPRSRWEAQSYRLHSGNVVCPKCKGSCKAGYCPQTFWRQAKSTLPDCTGCKGKGFIRKSHWNKMVEAQALAHAALAARKAA